MKLVIFDFDGTIFSLPVDWKGLKRELKKQLEEGSNKVELSITEILDKAGDRREELERIIQSYEIKAVKKAKPNREILEIYKNSVKSGYVTAIYSTNYSKTISKAFRKHNLSMPRVIVGRGEVKKGKPSAEGVKMILKKLGEKPRTAVLIGDKEIDEKTAENAGIKFMSVEKPILIRKLLFKDG